MGRPLWLVRLIKRYFPRRFLIAKLTKTPIIGRILDYWLFEGDDIIYLPRNQAIQINKSLDVPEEMALPSQVVEHFIEKSNYHWIMNVCICRDAMKCEDYPVDLGCLFLGEAALGINPQLGRHVTKEEALEHVRHCREAGLVFIWLAATSWIQSGLALVRAPDFLLCATVVPAVVSGGCCPTLRPGLAPRSRECLVLL